MLTKAEVGRILGVSRNQGLLLVRQGCPQTSAEDVLEWRRNNPPRRRATNGKALKPEGGDDVEKGKPQRRVRTERQKTDAGEAVGVKKAVVTLPPVEKTGDSLRDALNNAIHVADMAFEEYRIACATNSPTRPLRLSEHSKALEARLKAEKAFREEMERREVLVDKAVVLETARQAIEAVLRRLKRLPQEVGPQCNPENPIHATKILEREVAAVISMGGREISGLSAKTKP